MAKKQKAKVAVPAPDLGYGELVSGISGLLEQARRTSARAVNAILNATYWEVGRRLVEFEQSGKARAEYGEGLIERLAKDLKAAHGRGFSKSNLFLMRAFYLGWEIFQTPSGKLEARATTEETSSREGPTTSLHPVQQPASGIPELFPLPWSHYVRLLSVPDAQARAF